MKTYAFWNNKGGTGKTSLAFQVVCRYANRHPNSRVLAVDVCPQCNLSELLLGGLTNSGSDNLLKQHGYLPRRSIGGYFQLRLPAPYAVPDFSATDFITNPNTINPHIPENVDLICGDPLLELQSNAINTLANAQIPGTNTWIAIIDWLAQLLSKVESEYDVAFLDANPSFSLYTQIALSCANELIMPVMADDSSRRAILNAFSLVYGLKLPSDIYATYAFATKLRNANRPLPKVHLVPKNRLTQYMGPASAYAAVLRSIEEDLESLVKSNPDIFSFSSVREGVTDVRDFQTTGVVSFARGCPFFTLESGKLDVGGHRVQVNENMRQNCIEAIDAVITKL